MEGHHLIPCTVNNTKEIWEKINRNHVFKLKTTNTSFIIEISKQIFISFKHNRNIRCSVLPQHKRCRFIQEGT